jgi:hypothetical protein
MTRTTDPSSPLRGASGKRLALTPLLLIGISLGLILPGPVSVAHAGEWVQRSCSLGTEYIAPEGWEGQENYGYDQMPNDNCERFLNGGGLLALATPLSGDQPLAGQTWLYKAPHDSTIAGGVLHVQMTARSGGAIVAADVKEELVTLASCESPGCHSFDRDVPITVVGATELYERAFCFSNSEGICPLPENAFHEGDGVFAAETNISTAQIALSTNATPTGSGFSGTLLNETVSGKGTLSFTATDPGPGVYQVRAKVNGEQVWAATPDLNEGKCVATGTTEGVRAFNYAQPCPAETAVQMEIDTTSLTDGPHALTVEVEDAAGNITTVYSGTLTTANYPASTIVVAPTTAPPNRGATNGTPVSENAVLAAPAKQPKAFTRTQTGSAVTLTGRLTDPAGTPIEGAQVQLSQQVVGSNTPSRIASTTTSTTGAWTFKVPEGPSRLLQIAYYSHLLDTVPAATLDFHESVQAAVSMHAPHRARLGHAIVFDGRLAGGYVPPSGESVQMEIFYGGRWRTIEVLPTTSRGRWAYKYVFTLGVGTSYLFRAVTVPNGSYPFLSAHSKPVRIEVGS